MAQQGAALQTYNNELVECLEDLCAKRDQLQSEINDREKEKMTLETQMKTLQLKLNGVNADLHGKLETKDKYDKLISESEQAYYKILESSQVLLKVVKKDAEELKRAKKNAKGEWRISKSVTNSKCFYTYGFSFCQIFHIWIPDNEIDFI